MKKHYSIFALFFLILVGCTEVKPGDEGFMYYQYGDGIDAETIYSEGTHSCAPWNEMITYNTRQQTQSYNLSVMDKNGTEINVVADVNFALIRGTSPKMHVSHGPEYVGSFVNPKAYGAIKDVIGRYTYEEVFSTKREGLEGEIEEMLESDFKENYLHLFFVEIKDVNLPDEIQKRIIEKEAQKQKNLIAEQRKVEEINLAVAKVEHARGDSAEKVIGAASKAQEIELIQKQLARDPRYIDYIRATRWNGSYGEGNVFGNAPIFKGIR